VSISSHRSRATDLESPVSGFLGLAFNVLGCYTDRMRPNQNTPWWMYILVIAVGAGVGLLVRPLVPAGFSLQNLFGGGGASSTLSTTAKVRCVGPAGSELALEEYVDPSSGEATTAGVTAASYQHRYKLERPGQPALTFLGVSDSNTFNVRCDNVKFGPGPRVAFGRGLEAFVVELVGPQIRNFNANNNPDIASLVVEPRWKLQFKLDAYAARAPEIAEDGKKGRLILEPAAAQPGYPAKIVLETADGGQTYKLNRPETMAGL
jgi:hypothetical protein